MLVEAGGRFAGPRSRPVLRLGSRLLVALVLVSTFVAHDGLMIGLAAIADAPTGAAVDHAAPHAPTDESHPDDCGTTQTAALAARVAAAAHLAIGSSPMTWPRVAAETSPPARPGALPLLRRGPPRALLQIWRV